MILTLLGFSHTALPKTDSWKFAVLLSGEGIEGTHLLIERKHLSIEQCMFMLGGYAYQSSLGGLKVALPLTKDDDNLWSVMMKGTYDEGKEVFAVILCRDDSIQT